MNQEKLPPLESSDSPSASSKQRIMAAALKLFVEQGYFNTNVPDLSKLSRCSVGSIYHTFKNKEEIAASLYEESIAAFRQALTKSIEKAGEPEEVVKSLVTSFMTFAEVNHQLSRYIWLCRHGEFLDKISSHPTSVGFDALGRKLTRSIRKGEKSGQIRTLPAQILWSVIFGIPLAYVRDWLDGFNKVSPIHASETIADAVWRALKA
jgi:AcrR family transcriptional regulator